MPICRKTSHSKSSREHGNANLVKTTKDVQNTTRIILCPNKTSMPFSNSSFVFTPFNRLLLKSCSRRNFCIKVSSLLAFLLCKQCTDTLISLLLLQLSTALSTDQITTSLVYKSSEGRGIERKERFPSFKVIAILLFKR